MHVFKRKTRPLCVSDPPPDTVDPQTAPSPPEAPAARDEIAPATHSGATQAEAAGETCRFAAGNNIDGLAAALVPELQHAVRDLAGRLTEVVDTKVESAAAQLHSLVSTAAVRGIHRPIIDRCIALLDRIRAELKHQRARRPLNAEAGRCSDCSRLHEQYDAMVVSFIDELESLLRGFDVVPISVPAGEFNCRLQQIVAVEPTGDAGLDGQVSEVIRPGCLWAGAVLRPEQVRIFKKEK